MRPSIVHDIRFQLSIFDSIPTGGVAGRIDHPEPPAGYFHLPVAWTVAYSGATAITDANGQLTPTSSALDPWGRYSAGSAMILGSCQPYASLAFNMPCIPYMRGYQLSFVYSTPAAATTATSRLLYLEIPAELVSLDMWMLPWFPNWTFNHPVP